MPRFKPKSKTNGPALTPLQDDPLRRAARAASPIYDGMMDRDKDGPSGRLLGAALTMLRLAHAPASRHLAAGLARRALAGPAARGGTDGAHARAALAILDGTDGTDGTDGEVRVRAENWKPRAGRAAPSAVGPEEEVEVGTGDE